MTLLDFKSVPPFRLSGYFTHLLFATISPNQKPQPAPFYTNMKRKNDIAPERSLSTKIEQAERGASDLGAGRIGR
jgi:beta-phosphoglucomutase-like phosphatase (HAD superfamily)